MIFEIADLLSSEDVDSICDRLHQAEFSDGQLTAGWHAKLVKNNLQLAKSEHSLSEILGKTIAAALKRHPLFQSAVRPQSIHSIRFSRYDAGMFYGRHTDNALMHDQGHDYRSDVSFTVFLSNPDTYEGGELVTELSDGDRTYKLSAGSAIIYPASTLHRVEPVTHGQRLAAVGWVRSWVRDPARREVLFDLDTARRAIFQKEGKSAAFDLISKSHANLLRMWMD